LLLSVKVQFDLFEINIDEFKFVEWWYSTAEMICINLAGTVVSCYIIQQSEEAENIFINSTIITFRYQKTFFSGIYFPILENQYFLELILPNPSFWQCIGKTCFKIGNSKCLQLMAA